jgi:acetolactate synthase-1/2/3 large subunit
MDLDQTCRRQIPNLTGLKYVYPRLKTQRIKHPKDLREGVAQALAEPGPVLVDVWVDKAENVIPMVRPGHRLDQMIES